MIVFMLLVLNEVESTCSAAVYVATLRIGRKRAVNVTLADEQL